MTEELSPIYYMRDDHTFKHLSADVDTAIVEIEAEFNAGYTCGMLCSKRPGFKNIHAHGDENRFKFFAECKKALESALTAAPTPPAQTTPEPVGGPWGWAIEDKHGVAQAIRPARKEFFGCVQSTEPFTAEDIAKMDREWVGIAPHRIVTLHTRPAEQPAVPEDVARDAERYRTIRPGRSWPCAFASSDAPEPLTGDNLDAAIDAARAAEKGGA